MKLRNVLLGLIYLHPSVSGYELKNIIQKSTGYFFQAALSQIYPALKTLTEEGFITFLIEPLVGKQDRKVYSITEEGKQQLISWLRSPLESVKSFSAFEDFLLRLTFIGILDNEQILSFLNDCLASCEQEKQRVTQNNLSLEKAYLKSDPEMNERFTAIWREENKYFEGDLDRKIAFIEDLIEKTPRL